MKKGRGNSWSYQIFKTFSHSISLLFYQRNLLLLLLLLLFGGEQYFSQFLTVYFKHVHWDVGHVRKQWMAYPKNLFHVKD